MSYSILQIELIAHCNRRCGFCPVGTGARTYPKGVMPLAQSAQLLDQAKKIGVREIVPFLNGEPFIEGILGYSFWDYLSLIEERGFDCRIYTNGINLTPDTVDRLAEYRCVVQLLISLQAVNQDTYSLRMIGGNYVQVAKHARYAIAKMGSKVMVRKTDFGDEMDNDLFLSQWGKNGELSLYYNYAGALKDALAPRFDKFNCFLLNRDILTVFWDGTVVLCCLDYNGEVQFGNVFKRPLKEIWDEYKEKVNKPWPFPICRKCNAGVV